MPYRKFLEAGRMFLVLREDYMHADCLITKVSSFYHGKMLDDIMRWTNWWALH